MVGPHDGAKKRVPEENAIATVTDLGLTRKQVHEARQIRDAEKADPGIIRRTLDERPEQKQEPPKAAVREAMTNVVQLRANQDYAVLGSKGIDMAAEPFPCAGLINL